MSTLKKNEDLSLSLFKESITPQGHSALGIQAYRMDSDGGSGKASAMTEYAGFDKLNKPFCCDYLYIKNQKAVLIEDTHLEAKAKKILQELKENKSEKDTKDEKNERSELDHIISDNGAKQKYIKKFIRNKYCLKVYGSLLILCRLTQKHANISQELKNKKFLFWLVINDTTNIPAIDGMGLKSFLKNSITDSLIKKKLIENTEILLIDQLEEKIKKLQ